MQKYKIVVLGSSGVGKSALITRLLSDTFVERYDPTLEEKYKTHLMVDGQSCTVDILDTAGTEQFVAMRDLYIKNGDGFILIYSITEAASLMNTVEIFQNLMRVRQKYHFPLILVGNKSDDATNRQVLRTNGEKYAMQYNSTFCEASARLNLSVFEIFEDIVRQIRIEKQLDNQQSDIECKRWYASSRESSVCCFM